jgi:hypothetical protein
MGRVEQDKTSSWLSLVAETAGVSGATITRVQLQGFAGQADAVRAIVQVLDSRGRVIGASYWDGDSRELAQGVMVDLGCDLGAALGSRIVGWIVDEHTGIEARRAVAPYDAAGQYFDPTRAMKLMLTAPAPAVAAA